MSDPNYYHEFTPNRAGRCKLIVSGSICHRTATAEVHQRPAHWEKPATPPSQPQSCDCGDTLGGACKKHLPPQGGVNTYDETGKPQGEGLSPERLNGIHAAKWNWPVPARDVVNELCDELDRMRQQLRQLCADTTDGMECLPECDSVAHAELCPLTNPVEAWRKLRQQLAEAERERDCENIARRALGKSSSYWESKCSALESRLAAAQGLLEDFNEKPLDWWGDEATASDRMRRLATALGKGCQHDKATIAAFLAVVCKHGQESGSVAQFMAAERKRAVEDALKRLWELMDMTLLTDMILLTRADLRNAIAKVKEEAGQ